MADQSNINRHNSRSVSDMLRDFQSFDFLTSFPTSWQPPVTSSNENPDIQRLKLKINSFLRDYPNILPDIRDYFYDELMTFALKQALKIKFSQNDMEKIEKLFDRFFVEHEENIRIILNYFLEDIKPFLPQNVLLSFTTDFVTMNATMKRSTCSAVLLFLKTTGARLITSQLFNTEIVIKPVKKYSPKQPILQIPSTYDATILLPIFACIFTLCGIFGLEIFRFIFYFFIGVILTVFFIYLFMKK